MILEPATPLAFRLHRHYIIYALSLMTEASDKSGVISHMAAEKTTDSINDDLAVVYVRQARHSSSCRFVCDNAAYFFECTGYFIGDVRKFACITSGQL